MGWFVEVSVHGRPPCPAELTVELGRRVIYTLQPPQDQFYPDDEPGIRILRRLKQPPKNLQPIGKELTFCGPPRRCRRSHRNDLRGGLDCGSRK